MWGQPGGLCELGEAPLDTLKREVFEETALHVRAAHLLDLLHSPLRTLPGGDQACFYTAVYLVTDWHGTTTPDHTEGDELAFFGAANLPTLRGVPGAWAGQWLRAQGTPGT